MSAKLYRGLLNGEEYEFMYVAGQSIEDAKDKVTKYLTDLHMDDPETWGQLDTLISNTNNSLQEVKGGCYHH